MNNRKKAGLLLLAVLAAPVLLIIGVILFVVVIVGGVLWPAANPQGVPPDLRPFLWEREALNLSGSIPDQMALAIIAVGSKGNPLARGGLMSLAEGKGEDNLSEGISDLKSLLSSENGHIGAAIRDYIERDSIYRNSSQKTKLAKEQEAIGWLEYHIDAYGLDRGAVVQAFDTVDPFHKGLTALHVAKLLAFQQPPLYDYYENKSGSATILALAGAPLGFGGYGKLNGGTVDTQWIEPEKMDLLVPW
ncbi:MAG: hypothetical protein U7M05_11810, partial [Candidatus Igneacidithiobacillus chanchocoensis]